MSQNMRFSEEPRVNLEKWKNVFRSKCSWIETEGKYCN